MALTPITGTATAPIMPFNFMAINPVTIPISWTAFVKEKSCLGYREFPAGGKYYGVLTLVSKPTKAELLAELDSLKITLPQ